MAYLAGIFKYCYELNRKMQAPLENILNAVINKKIDSETKFSIGNDMMENDSLVMFDYYCSYNPTFPGLLTLSCKFLFYAPKLTNYSSLF